MADKCSPQPRLFDQADLPHEKKPRRVARVGASRAATQVHLPIFSGEDLAMIRYGELVDATRPLSRADCQGTARPCPFVDCSMHLFNGRFLLFERLIDSIDVQKGEKVTDAIARRIGEDGWPVGVDEDELGNLTFERINLRDESGSVLPGPLPTCALDVAEQVATGAINKGEMSNEDVARLTGQTREGVRVLISRVGPQFARQPALMPWLLEVATREEIAALSGVDYFGDDD